MCGILVALTRPGVFDYADIQRSIGTLNHRGPDNTGIKKVTCAGNDVWLAHARLSILDVSSAAHQPFVAPDGSVLVFNGEVYNHGEISKELKNDWDFKTTSDTEVLLAGLQKYGTEVFEKANGMFACVYLNANTSELIVARDRLGKKPLYVFRSPEMIVFASELKAIVALGQRLTVNTSAMSYFRWLGYIPAEMCVYNECQKFPASSVQRIAAAGLREEETRSFWDPLQVCAERFEGSYEDAQREFLELLDDATRIRLEADVPVGVFLSGGIDSSLVASSVARVQSKSTTAFTVASTDASFDESNVAIDTARRLGLAIEVLKVSELDYPILSQKLIDVFDEPFADQSAIPTMAISREAAKHVKVVLTGDGGDEAFCGYPWHCYPGRLFRYRPPFSNNRFANRSYHSLLESSIAKAGLYVLAKLLRMNTNNLSIKRSFCHELLDAQSPVSLYDTFQCAENFNLLSRDDRDRLGPDSLMTRVQSWQKSLSWSNLDSRNTAEQLACLDMFSYLRDDVLVKVDRSTMAFGLEARSPLLDYRIIEFGLRIPFHFKVRGNRHKCLLRDALQTRIEGELSNLPKKGFGIPLPDNLPEAPSPRGRWVRWVEQNWQKRWIA